MCLICGLFLTLLGSSTNTNYMFYHIWGKMSVALDQLFSSRLKFSSAGMQSSNCAVSCRTIKHQALILRLLWPEWNILNIRLVVDGGKTATASMSRQALKCMNFSPTTKTFVAVWALLITDHPHQVSDHSKIMWMFLSHLRFRFCQAGFNDKAHTIVLP